MEIFVAGSSRSGTTLVARTLAAHSEVHALPELHVFEQIWNPASPAHADCEKLARVAAEPIAVVRQGYLSKRAPDAFRRARVGSSRTSAKRPTKEPRSPCS